MKKGESDMIAFRKYTVRDILFLAVLAAVLLLVGMLTMPLVMAVDLFGLRNLASAPLYGFFCAIGLLRVPKPGALTLVALFLGTVLLMMSPLMTLNHIIGALLAEGITLLIFRGYRTKTSILTVCGLFIPLTLPLSLVFNLAINGKSFAEIITYPLYSVLLSLGTVALSFLGAWLGLRLGRELEKAGVLKS